MPVDVMAVFFGQERSPENSSHNDSMFKDRLAFSGYGDRPNYSGVPVATEVATSFAIEKASGGDVYHAWYECEKLRYFGCDRA